MDDWKVSRIGCCSDLKKNIIINTLEETKLFIVLFSCSCHEHSRRQFVVPGSLQIGVCNWLLPISKPLSAFFHVFEISSLWSLSVKLPWTDGLMSQITTSSSRLLSLPSWKALQGVGCDKPLEWMRASNPLPETSGNWSILSDCTSRIQLCLYALYKRNRHRKHQLQRCQLMPACVSLQGNSALAVPGSIWLRGVCRWRSEALEGGLTRGIKCFLYLGISFCFLLSN